MILVFGGTTEGKIVSGVLDDLNIPYYYTTKTKVPFTGKGTAIYGAMDQKLLREFCEREKIDIILNAAHPFAEQLHKTIVTVPEEIQLYRWERHFEPREKHPEVFYVAAYNQVLQLLENLGYTSMLALSGVQTISHLKRYWEENKTWFRILDRDSSRNIALASGFPETQLIYGYPQSAIEEKKLFRDINPEVIFTKESGSSGKLYDKIKAAVECAIPIVILERPILSDRYIRITKKQELIKLMSKQYS
ncbi:precorrin-6A/cobalt-precorrin-6A reductase [Aquimarina hainanensis]|uniref:Precorrin-6A/cobalt-precorrin-6A reductase n=1 Tax=Aquimarina hainanensis TaxID=1578017 RepID=A0ABW5ND62_9FLAO